MAIDSGGGGYFQGYRFRGARAAEPQCAADIPKGWLQPRATAHGGEPSGEEFHRAAQRGAQIDMSKILLVEDNEMNRDMLSRRLQRRGYEVIMAVDGEQGLQLAHGEAPDLILMDMSLPVVDGWEATRRLKADPQTRSIPVVALTAHAMSDDRERALAAGCDDYDTKPIELTRLLPKIEALLEQKGAS